MPFARFISSRCILFSLCFAVMLPACTSRQEQLHRVAKDWCETIRASQVVAVYPLTQDLQPGDVFLVQTPIDEQQSIYREDGFLPLDNHLARLEPGGYGDFYDYSFLDPDKPRALPKDWMVGNWASAPRVAFPTYGFQVSEGQGINLAVPVSGVPVGLSLLNTQSASGTISLKDARTLGVDTESLYQQIRTWATDNADRRTFLANFGVRSGDLPRNYLRVVTRVYLLGAIDVQLNDARSVSGGVDAGVPRPVELFLPKLPGGVKRIDQAGQESYLRGVQRLNAMVGTGAPVSSQGADAGLSAEAFAAREQGREQARSAELQRLTAAQTTAQQAMDTATATARASTEGKDLGDAQQDLADAISTRDQRANDLENERAQDTPNQANIQQAAAALTAAEADVRAAELALAKAQVAYDKAHGATIQQKAGELDIQQAAISRIQDFAPGGSFRFTAASARSISMTETFDKPLVVGYLGFDVPIGVNGELGGPIPTFNIVADRPMTEPIKWVGAFTSAEVKYKDLRETIRKLIPPPDQDEVYARAASLMGRTSKATYDDQIGQGETAEKAWRAVSAEQLPRTLRNRSEKERRYQVMSKALNGALREYLDKH